MAGSQPSSSLWVQPDFDALDLRAPYLDLWDALQLPDGSGFYPCDRRAPQLAGYGRQPSGGLERHPHLCDALAAPIDVVAGSDLAFAPSFQGNLRVRYEWDLSDTLEAYVQPQVSYSASKFTDVVEINKLELDSYTVVDFAAGVMSNNWKFEVFGDNLFDERAQISGNYVNDRARITTNRPLTVGFRVGYDY